MLENNLIFKNATKAFFTASYNESIFIYLYGFSFMSF